MSERNDGEEEGQSRVNDSHLDVMGCSQNSQKNSQNRRCSIEECLETLTIFHAESCPGKTASSERGKALLTNSNTGKGCVNVMKGVLARRYGLPNRTSGGWDIEPLHVPLAGPL